MVQTIGFQSLYVFFFISHEHRELIHFNLTASPTAAWIWRQTIEDIKTPYRARRW